MMTRRTAQQLFSNQRLQRWCFDVELVYLAQQLKVSRLIILELFWNILRFASTGSTWAWCPQKKAKQLLSLSMSHRQTATVFCCPGFVPCLVFLPAIVTCRLADSSWRAGAHGGAAGELGRDPLVSFFLVNSLHQPPLGLVVLLLACRRPWRSCPWCHFPYMVVQDQLLSRGVLRPAVQVPMAEVQVNWTEVPGSKIRPTSMVHMAMELAAIKLGYGLGLWAVRGEEELGKRQ